MSHAAALVRNSSISGRLTSGFTRLKNWPILHASPVQVACFSTSESLSVGIGSGKQKKGSLIRLPYDDRFPPRPLDFWDAPMGAWPEYDPKNDPDALKEGGGDYGVNEPGYYLDGNFVYVKEMVPEYVVPDLTDCELLPYVPYNVKTVTQPAMSAEDLFEVLYRNEVEKNAQKIIEDGEEPASLGQLTERLFGE